MKMHIENMDKYANFYKQHSIGNNIADIEDMRGYSYIG
jgi:hypothetical protein